MEFDLQLVLVVVVTIIVLVGVVYLVMRRRGGANKKTKRLIDNYIRERAKENRSLQEELANLDRMLSSKQIDKETYDRLKNVLVTMKGKRNLDAEDLFDYVSEKQKPQQKD